MALALSVGSGALAQTSAGAASAAMAELERLLGSGRFPAAVELYDAFYERHAETVSGPLRERLLEFAQQTLAAGAPGAAVELLAAYTRIYFQDFAALRLLAGAYREAGERGLELDSLMQALDAAADAAGREAVAQDIDAAVGAYAEQLLAQQAAAELAALYEALLVRLPESGRYHLALARLYVQLDRSEDAALMLEQARYLPDAAAQAQEMLAALEQAAPAPAAAGRPVGLLRLGSHYAVETVLNDAVTALLVIDTGASLSVIAPEVLQRAGVLPEPGGRSVSLQTAGGAVTAPLYALGRLSVGDRAVAGVRVAALRIPALAGADGLLGMDFLRRFRFAIDHEAGTLLFQD